MKRVWQGWVKWTLLGFAILAVGSDFIASDEPLLYRSPEGTWSVPVIGGARPTTSWKEQDGFRLLAPVPFNPQNTDLSRRYLPPLSAHKVADRTYYHWLGTDRLGRDVAAGMIHGCRKSLWVGLLAMILAVIVGIVLGAISGFYGNKKIRLGAGFYWIGVPLGIYLIYLDSIGAIKIGTCLLIWVIVLLLQNRFIAQKKTYRFPFDAILMRLIEVFSSIPSLLLLLALSAVFQATSLSLLALIIALLRWPRIALFVRSEVQKIAALPEITAARISGQSERTILTRFILPEALTPVLVLFAFGVATVILLESTLSFLGIGVPLDVVTWGSLLGQARENIQAWWLAVYPGTAIFLLVFSLNQLGERLRLWLNPHLRI